MPLIWRLLPIKIVSIFYSIIMSRIVRAQGFGSWASILDDSPMRFLSVLKDDGNGARSNCRSSGSHLIAITGLYQGYLLEVSVEKLLGFIVSAAEFVQVLQHVHSWPSFFSFHQRNQFFPDILILFFKQVHKLDKPGDHSTL